MNETMKKIGCSLGPLALRLGIGVIFIAHGYQKLFVKGVSAVSASFTQSGIIAPQIFGPLVSGIEFFCGIALVLGIVTPLAAFLLACVMAVAVIHVHAPNGLIGPNGMEYPLSLLAGNIALLFCGGGKFSLDGLIFCKSCRQEEQK